jgi:hypothetical protein
MSHPNWDWHRFVQTLTYFDVIPVVGWWQRLIQGETNTGVPTMITSDDALMIFDFSPREAAAPRQAIATLWGALDDVVMGGVSTSGLKLTATAALFTGTVSTANSGGFASIRTRNLDPALDLSSYSGLRLRLKGDGNRYKFLLRGGAGWDSLAHAYAFDTVVDTWMVVDIPFDQLVPTLRARTVPNAAPLDRRQIYSLQLMLSKFEYDGRLNPHFTPGGFALEVGEIAAYR